MKKSTGLYLFLLASCGANALLRRLPPSPSFTMRSWQTSESKTPDSAQVERSPSTERGFPTGTTPATATAPVSGVTVNVGGIAGWVFYESAAQGIIEAQIPFNAPIGATQVTVTTSADLGGLRHYNHVDSTDVDRRRNHLVRGLCQPPRQIYNVV